MLVSIMLKSIDTLEQLDKHFPYNVDITREYRKNMDLNHLHHAQWAGFTDDCSTSLCKI